MKKKMLFIAIIIIFNCSFTIDDYIFCEVSNSFQTLKFSKEGLLLFKYEFDSGKRKTKFIDISKIGFNKINQFQIFLKENNFFLYKSNYNAGVVMGGVSTKIILQEKDNFKVIYYFECVNDKLDSIIYYMNTLIPKKYKKDFEIHYEIGIKRPCN